MRELAAEEHVRLLDLQALTLARRQQLGPDGTWQYDNHFVATEGTDPLGAE
ncbi:hypothetical protein ACFCX0_12300 [Streptomyces sp. NPDC056352]|uniref:hypothetical protein n=1 Tax=Streptomyces sp. NPDC056352 TaxID=3345791 RepID=UPI0035D947A9